MQAHYLGNAGNGSSAGTPTPTFNTSVPRGAIVVVSLLNYLGDPPSVDSRGNSLGLLQTLQDANYGVPVNWMRVCVARVLTPIQAGDTIVCTGSPAFDVCKWSLDAFTGVTPAAAAPDKKSVNYGPVAGYGSTSKAIGPTDVIGGSLLLTAGLARAFSVSAPTITDSAATLAEWNYAPGDAQRVAYRIVPADVSGNQAETFNFAVVPDISIQVLLQTLPPDIPGRATVFGRHGARIDLENGWGQTRTRVTAGDGSEGAWATEQSAIEVSGASGDYRSACLQRRRDGNLLASFTTNGTAYLVGCYRDRLNSLNFAGGAWGLSMTLGSPFYGVAHHLDERSGLLATVMYSVADRSWYLKVGQLNSGGSSFVMSAAVLLEASAHNSAAITCRRDGVWVFACVKLDGTVVQRTCRSLRSTGAGTWS